MINEQFIETVITPKNETEHTEKQTMISRELYGMEAVAQNERVDKFAPRTEEDE